MSDSKSYKATLKAGGGYEEPWLTVEADSTAELADKLQAAETTGILALIGRVAGAFRAHSLVGSQLGATPVAPPQAAPQYAGQAPAQQYPQQAPTAPQGGYQAPAQGVPNPNTAQPPPGVVAPACHHGPKRWVNGKYGPFWGCPAPKGAPDQCPIQKA